MPFIQNINYCHLGVGQRRASHNTTINVGIVSINECHNLTFYCFRISFRTQTDGRIILKASETVCIMIIIGEIINLVLLQRKRKQG